MTGASQDAAREVVLALPDARLPGWLACPDGARGVVAFAHGSGSSRYSPRNLAVASALQRSGLATLLFDLLRPDEDARGPDARFDIALLARRLAGALAWLGAESAAAGLAVGLFGASTGAAAALRVAAQAPERVAAVVSRGGRPDLALDCLPTVRCPTLLIVGERDRRVLQLNRAALAQLACEKALKVVAGATHLFEEPGALDEVAALARAWFERHLRPLGRAAAAG